MQITEAACCINSGWAPEYMWKFCSPSLFPKSEGVSFLLRRSKYMGILRSLSLNSSYCNTDFKRWENGEIHKMIKCMNVWLSGNCKRITHIYGLEFYPETFKEVKTWIHTGTMFPEDISSHFCHYLSHLCFLIL